MMNDVHPWRHNEPTQTAIDPARYSKIAVMKQNDRQRKRLIDHELEKRKSKQRNHDQSRDEGQHHFTRVEADAGADVQLGVGVMHRVESPEERDTVVDSMP